MGGEGGRGSPCGRGRTGGAARGDDGVEVGGAVVGQDGQVHVRRGGGAGHVKGGLKEASSSGHRW